MAIIRCLLLIIVLLLTWGLSGSYASKLGTTNEKNFVLKKSDLSSIEIYVVKLHAVIFMEPEVAGPNWTGCKDAILNENFTKELKFLYKDYNCSTKYWLLKRRYQSYKSKLNYKNTHYSFRS
jgi:hypothetical protein